MDRAWAHPQHKVYPYLLRGVAVTRPNQVWSTDIRLIELDPKYVDVIIRRWQQFTGREARLHVDCHAFTEVGEQRRS